MADESNTEAEHMASTSQLYHDQQDISSQQFKDSIDRAVAEFEHDLIFEEVVPEEKLESESEKAST